MAIRPSTPVLSGSAVQILNAIRNDGSVNYKEFVPYATPDADCIKQIGAILMQSIDLRNEFLTNLVNRIGKVIITSKLYRNPWNVFKKGELELGETVEEIFVGLAKAAVYDPASAKDKVFARSIPDVRAAFHVRNCELHYDVTVQREDIKKAFVTMEGVVDLITRIIEQVYTAAEYDEFNIMKYLLGCHILDGNIYPVTVPVPDSERDAKDVVIAVKATSKDFEYLKGTYNIAGVKTHSMVRDQYFIIPSAFEARMDVDVLAAAFNMEKAEYLAHRVPVDSFSNIDFERLTEIFTTNGALDPTFRVFTSDQLAILDTVQGVLVDRDFFQIYDNLNEMEEIRNPLGLYTNYFYHHWSIYSVSPFSNAAMFIANDSTPVVTSVTVQPSAPNAVKGGNVSFIATVVADADISHDVTWTVTGANKAATTIDGYGNLTIASDETALTLTVKAASVADSTKYGTATVTIYDNYPVYEGSVVIGG